MKLADALHLMGKEQSIEIAKSQTIKNHLDWEKSGICYVFSAILEDTERAPNLPGQKDSEEDKIRRWVEKYVSGSKNRPSIRSSNPPKTIPDPMIEQIIGQRLTNLNSEQLLQITYAHRIGMSAENILGLLLEEYIAITLKHYGWHCAWGETVKSVDFVHENGSLLQIKNRSNSENSSSSAIRHGTNIQKWFRIKANKIEYQWDKLNHICCCTELSEEGFVRFVKATIKSNPSCVAIEKNNPWPDIKSTGG